MIPPAAVAPAVAAGPPGWLVAGGIAAASSLLGGLGGGEAEPLFGTDEIYEARLFVNQAQTRLKRWSIRDLLPQMTAARETGAQAQLGLLKNIPGMGLDARLQGISNAQATRSGTLANRIAAAEGRPIDMSVYDQPAQGLDPTAAAYIQDFELPEFEQDYSRILKESNQYLEKQAGQVDAGRNPQGVTGGDKRAALLAGV